MKKNNSKTHYRGRWNPTNARFIGICGMTAEYATNWTGRVTCKTCRRFLLEKLRLKTERQYTMIVYQVMRDFGTDQQLVTRWTDEAMAIADMEKRNQEQAVLERCYKYVIVPKQEG